MQFAMWYHQSAHVAIIGAHRNWTVVLNVQPIWIMVGANQTKGECQWDADRPHHVLWRLHTIPGTSCRKMPP